MVGWSEAQSRSSFELNFQQLQSLACLRCTSDGDMMKVWSEMLALIVNGEREGRALIVYVLYLYVKDSRPTTIRASAMAWTFVNFFIYSYLTSMCNRMVMTNLSHFPLSHHIARYPMSPWREFFRFICPNHTVIDTVSPLENHMRLLRIIGSEGFDLYQPHVIIISIWSHIPQTQMDIPFSDKGNFRVWFSKLPIYVELRRVWLSSKLPAGDFVINTITWQLNDRAGTFDMIGVICWSGRGALKGLRGRVRWT